MDQVVLEPTGVGSRPGSTWTVIIRNNDTNTEEEVITVLIIATGCTFTEAAIETWEAHTFGQARVHFASRAACTAAAEIIRQIGVETVVVPEWE
ncbi:MAG: ATP-dependent Clp protease adaptor ClpS [Fimbriimonadaceae bacterium]